MRVIIRDKDTVRSGGTWRHNYTRVIHHGSQPDGMYLVVYKEGSTIIKTQIPMGVIESVHEYE